MLSVPMASISREAVLRAVSSPDKSERRGAQVFSSILLGTEFALMVVHEERKGIIVRDNLLSNQEEEIRPIE